MHLRYSYRIYPTVSQRVALARTFGCARVVYNDALAARKAAYKADKSKIKSVDLQKLVVTQAKRTEARAWLAEVGVDPLIQSLRDLDTAYKNFFESLSGKRRGRKVGLPVFKSKRDSRQSLRFSRNGFRLRVNGRLNLAKIGDVEVRWSRPLPAEPTSVTVTKEASGRYFCSFVVDVESETRPPVLDELGVPVEVGIDLGLTTYAVLSDGSIITNPRVLRRAEKKLKKAQRVLSRKAKGSKNRAKARIKVAKAHAKVADTRRDFLHKETTRLVGENQALYLEDLNVRGLARGRLARSVHDASWGTFRAMLESKADRFGRTVGIVHRAFPSSQICSECGRRDGPKPLGVRTWACGECGASHDRDLNAARNILAAGQADRLNAPGGPVSPDVAIPRKARPVERGTHLGDLAGTGVRATGAGGIPAH